MTSVYQFHSEFRLGSVTLEDESLLLGSVIAFVAIAVVVYMTRDVDWYSSMPVKLSGSSVENQSQP